MKIGRGTPPGAPRPSSHRVRLSDEGEQDRRGTSAPVRAGTSDWSTTGRCPGPGARRRRGRSTPANKTPLADPPPRLARGALGEGKDPTTSLTRTPAPHYELSAESASDLGPDRGQIPRQPPSATVSTGAEARALTAAIRSRDGHAAGQQGAGWTSLQARCRARSAPRRWVAEARTVHQPPSGVFELRRRDTGGLVHAYATEGAALAFVRDVIFIGGRDQAICLALQMRDELGHPPTLAEGLALVQ